MSFGQPFPPYASSLHNPQLLLAAAAAAASNIGSTGNPSTVNCKSNAPSDPSPSAASGQSLPSFACPPSSSTSATSNSGANLLTNSSESGDMSADGLRLLASAGGHHGLVPPPAGPHSLIPSSQPGGAGIGPPMPPMFAGLPSLEPYRFPPPHFGLYSGGISPAMLIPHLGLVEAGMFQGGPLDLKVPDGMPPPPFAHPTPSSMQPYYFDPAFASGYPYAADRFGNPLDLNGARRKNATRETTAALKAWLYEHRKNPYPTKGEKIMLAIITKMTLTQVSTWFANARRRLKKENKMTWSPRNRPGEDDDGVDGNSTTQENSGGPRPGSSLSSLGDDARDGDDDDVEDLGPDTVAVGCNLDEESAKRLIHGSMKSADGDEKSEASGSVKRPAVAEEASSPKKPKIWSIAETVASPDSSPQKPKPPTESPQQQQNQGPYHFTFPPWPHMAAAAAFAGRNPLMPPPNSAPTFPFGAMPPTSFAPVSMASLPHPHQLRPELFARNFFAPMPPTAQQQMMNAAAAAASGLPGFLNGFSFGCGPPPFPFGFGLPGAGNGSNAGAAIPTSSSQLQQQAQQQNGAGNEAGGSGDSSSDRPESKSRAVISAASVSPVSSNGGRRSSTSSQEPKANAS